ncbi:MAG: ABC transporter permease subunit [Actinomycetota bacterium]
MIRVELFKQLRRPRTWIVLGVVAVLSVGLTTVIGLSRPADPERVGDWLSVTTNTSGLTMPVIAMTAMTIFLFPLVVAIFAGECIAGEAAWGSLRYLLIHPTSRGRVLTAKALVAGTFSIVAVVIAVVVSLVTGVIAFGWHPLPVTDLQHSTPFYLAFTTFSPGEALGRIGIAVALVVASLFSTFGFSLLLSTLTTRPFSAVAGGVGLSLFSRAFDNIPGFAALRPGLPVTNDGANVWTGLFTRPSQTGGISHELLIQAAYGAACLAAAWWQLARRDVLS